MGKAHHDDTEWHLDRKVPLPLIVSLVFMFGAQLVGFSMWAANMSTRIESVERAISAAAPQAERLTRVEMNIGHIQRGVDKIEALIQGREAPSRAK